MVQVSRQNFIFYWKSSLQVLALALFFSLPAVISVFQTLLESMEYYTPSIPEHATGLESLYDSLHSWSGYLKKLATSEVVAGVLVSLGLVLMSFESRRHARISTGSSWSAASCSRTFSAVE